MIKLDYSTGEAFIQAFRKSCNEYQIELAPVNKKKIKRKAKDEFQEAVFKWINSANDGVWREATHTDTTCTNLRQMGANRYTLGALVYFEKNSHGVKFDREFMRLGKDEKKTCMYSLQKETLKNDLYTKLRVILESLGMSIQEIKCDSLGGDQKYAFIEITISNKSMDLPFPGVSLSA